MARITAKPQSTGAGRTRRNRNPCALPVGIRNGAAPAEASMGLLKQLKLELPCDPTIPLWGTQARRTESRASRRQLYTHVDRVPCTAAERRSDPDVHQQVDGQSKVTRYCSGMSLSLEKGGHSDTHASRMSPDDILLREVSRSQTHYRSHFHGVPRGAAVTEFSGDARGRARQGAAAVYGYRASILQGDMDSCATISIHLTLLNCALKNGRDGEFCVRYLNFFK